jgi:inner membrane protein
VPSDGLPVRSAAVRTTTWLAARPTVAAALCVGAALLVGLLDAALTAGREALPVTAALDWPAHVVTTGLVLAALLPWRARAVVPWALVGAVLIDLDHIPFYLWGALSTEDAGRPVTHSVATAVLLAVAAAMGPRRLRTALCGLSLGVCLHLVRDLATGPGVPLWWPVEDDGVLLPYWVYALVLVAAAAVAASRQARGSVAARPRSSSQSR